MPPRAACASPLSRQRSGILASALRQLSREESRKEHRRHLEVLLARICLRLSLAGGRCQIMLGSCGMASQCDMTGRMPSLSRRRRHTPLSSRTAVQTSHCDHEMRSSVRTMDRRVSLRRPLGRFVRGRQAETETPIMTSTLWGFSCSLQRRPNGAKNLDAIHGAKGAESWQCWFLTVRCEYEWAGRQVK